jgi:predicted anti-sigma-YlaC factor YlaD
VPRFRSLAAAAHPVLALVALLALAATLAGCSVQKFALRKVADSLTRGPDVYGTDDDPDLVGDALPFGLKTMESLLQALPRHEGLLLTLCRGYTSYAFAFVQSEGDLLVNSDYARAQQLKARALKLDLRARDYGLRGLEVRYPGIAQALQLDPAAAAARIQGRDVPMLYWTAVAWGSAIALGKDQPALLADLPAIRALFDRGLALDEGYEGGAFHEALIVLDALPPAMGGSEEKARAHFRRAVELGRDARPGPYVTLAQSVAVQKQDRAEFRTLLEKALSFDPDRLPAQRLVTTVLQRKAQALLDRQDEFFIDDGTTTAPDTTKTQENR